MFRRAGREVKKIAHEGRVSGRTVPALADPARGEGGAALFPLFPLRRVQQRAENVPEDEHVVVQEQQMTRAAVLERGLIADAQPVGAVVQPGRVRGLEIKPVIRLEERAGPPQLLAHIAGKQHGIETVVS